MIDFTEIFQSKDLKSKNKGHMNIYERCDLTKKVYLTYLPMCSFIDDKTNRISSWYILIPWFPLYFCHIFGIFYHFLKLTNHQIFYTKWRKNLIRLALNPFFHGPFAIIAIITSSYIQFLIFRLALLRCTTTRNYFSNSSLNDQRPWDSKDPTLNILSINGFTT